MYRFTKIFLKSTYHIDDFHFVIRFSLKHLIQNKLIQILGDWTTGAALPKNVLFSQMVEHKDGSLLLVPISISKQKLISQLCFFFPICNIVSYSTSNSMVFVYISSIFSSPLQSQCQTHIQFVAKSIRSSVVCF